MKKRKIIRSKTLVRILPKLGYCSRTEAFGLIRSGRVRVKGREIDDPNAYVKDGSSVSVNGEGVSKKKARCILFHKPAGVVTTKKDERGRTTVYDVLGDVGEWVFPVGRLDKETEGLLIFTNDTLLGDTLTDPANKIERTYIVTVNGGISDEDIRKIRNGVDIGRGERSRPAACKVLKKKPRATACKVVLTEGKNREIRRLFKAIGRSVTRLVRISFGPYKLGTLKPGEWREETR
ncbi:MAG: pseudouridine synthase [Candidatus Omnitrophota bacterium]